MRKERNSRKKNAYRITASAPGKMIITCIWTSHRKPQNRLFSSGQMWFPCHKHTHTQLSGTEQKKGGKCECLMCNFSPLPSECHSRKNRKMRSAVHNYFNYPYRRHWTQIRFLRCEWKRARIYSPGERNLDEGWRLGGDGQWNSIRPVV